MGALPVLAAGVSGFGPPTNAPPSWKMTSSADSEMNSAAPTRNLYQRPGKSVPLSGRL